MTNQKNKRRYLLYFIPLLLLVIAVVSCQKSEQNQQISAVSQVHPKENLEFVRKQLRYALSHGYDPSRGYPRTVASDSLVWVPAGDWTSGFFPGELWLMYKHTGNKYWKKKAKKWTAGLKAQQYNTGTHDVGFMMGSSYGIGYRLTGNKKYKKILIQSAKSLATRYDPDVGAIKSWSGDRWEYPVIIDNMMNLELLFFATKLSGDSTFYRIAKQHALTTLKHHFRPDGSSFHVVSYDSTSGEVLSRDTWQGYADSSSWGRGQSWGLYGFTMAYRYTRDERFLRQAQEIANFMLTSKHLPEDGVPYWDYDAPGIPDALRDVSAAAIMSSAFIKLSHYVAPRDSARYIKAAATILNSLSQPPYRAQKIGSNHGFILRESVGSKPHDSEVSVPLVYSDYYYIQANLRYLKLMQSRTK